MAFQPVLQARIEEFLLGVPGASPSPFFATLNTPSPDYPCLALGPSQTQGDWRAVWGPVVYQAPLNPGATNMMFVAHSPSLNTYVVAIAGTNPTGDTALFVEDLDVAPAKMVSWPPGVNPATMPPTLNWTSPAAPSPTLCLIDAGTADGIGVLYTMRDSTTQATLAAFLNGVSRSGQTLVFTGHSLGGALSPTMAMLLYPNAASSTNPNNAARPNLGSQWANVFILPTAGPTPGTAAFAALFAGPYAPVATNVPKNPSIVPFLNWNMIYANSWDVMPLAWNELAGLVQLPVSLNADYNSFFAQNSQLATRVDGIGLFAAGPDTYGSVQASMRKSGYGANGTPWYVPCLQHAPFTGNWGKWAPKATTYPNIWNADIPPSQLPTPQTIATMSDLVPWILNAHLGQYSKALLGFPCPTLEDVSA